MDTNKTVGMVQPNVQQRAVWWSLEFTKLLMKRADLRDSLPDNATFIVLPADDVELCEYNRRISKGLQGTVILVELEPAEDAYRVTPFISGQSYQIAGTLERPSLC